MSDQLQIESDAQPGSHRVCVRGELDLTSASILTSAVSELCAGGARRIVLDISELSFIDSSGLRAILGCAATCEARRCRFSLFPAAANINEQARRLFEITGLLSRLPFEDAEALGR